MNRVNGRIGRPRGLRNERGQGLALTSIFIFAFMAMVAVVVNVGYLSYVADEVQILADAAATARVQRGVDAALAVVDACNNALPAPAIPPAVADADVLAAANNVRGVAPTATADVECSCDPSSEIGCCGSNPEPHVIVQTGNYNGTRFLCLPDFGGDCPTPGGGAVVTQVNAARAIACAQVEPLLGGLFPGAATTSTIQRTATASFVAIGGAQPALPLAIGKCDCKLVCASGGFCTSAGFGEERAGNLCYPNSHVFAPYNHVVGSAPDVGWVALGLDGTPTSGQLSSAGLYGPSSDSLAPFLPQGSACCPGHCVPPVDGGCSGDLVLHCCPDAGGECQVTADGLCEQGYTLKCCSDPEGRCTAPDGIGSCAPGYALQDCGGSGVPITRLTVPTSLTVGPLSDDSVADHTNLEVLLRRMRCIFDAGIWKMEGVPGVIPTKFIVPIVNHGCGDPPVGTASTYGIVGFATIVIRDFCIPRTGVSCERGPGLQLIGVNHIDRSGSPGGQNFGTGRLALVN